MSDTHTWAWYMINVGSKKSQKQCFILSMPPARLLRMNIALVIATGQAYSLIPFLILVPFNL